LARHGRGPGRASGSPGGPLRGPKEKKKKEEKKKKKGKRRRRKKRKERKKGFPNKVLRGVHKSPRA
jgi:hypothetical protein